MRRGKRARGVLGLLLVLGVLGFYFGQEGSAANAILDKIEIEVKSQHQIPVGTAVVGDSVKILAVLKPKMVGTAVEELNIRFFFENRSTKETGLIGQASIPGLLGLQGEFRKAAVVWSPASMEPGYYNILAVGEFETSIGEGETTLKVLQEGKHFEFVLNSLGVPVDVLGNEVISRHLMGEDVARMPSGNFQPLAYMLKKEKKFYIVNLGTENITSGDAFNLKCEYKTVYNDTFEELVEGCTVVGLAPGSIGPGEEGQLRLFLQFPFGFQGVVPGESTSVQLRIQATDQGATSPTSPPLYLPNKDESFAVYSWVDLWTYPEPVGASSGDTGMDVSLAPVVVPTWTTYTYQARPVTYGELAVFHVETTEAAPKNSVLYSHAIAVTKDIKYYVKKYHSRWTDSEGGAVAWTPPEPAAEILAFTAVKNPQGIILLYVATSDGRVFGLQDNAAKDPLFPDNFRSLWPSDAKIPISSNDVSVPPFQHPPDVVTDADGNPVFVVFGADAGLFAFDAYSGAERWRITESDKIPVTQAPSHFEAGDIWFASKEEVYRFWDPGVGTPRPEEVEGAAITAPIALQTYTDTATEVVVLAEEGTLIVRDPSLLKPSDVGVCSRCTITGVSITGDSQATVKIYPTSDDGIELVEYSNGVYKLREYTSVDCPFRPSYDGDPSGSPALLVGIDGRVSAFVTTTTGELRAYDGEVCKRLEVVLWPLEGGQPVGEKDTFARFYFDTSVALTPPAVGVLTDPDTGERLLEVLFFGAGDGRLYALDLTRRGREQYWRFE